MSTPSPLRWGILGAGLIAGKLADALRLDPDSRLVAVASRTPGKADTFAAGQREAHGDVAALSYDELVARDDVDVVYVANTHNFHHESTRLALEHGKHALVEKPFTVNAGQARRLVALARERGLFLMEAIWVRFLPSYQRLKAELAHGAIGEVRLIDVTFGHVAGPQYIERLTRPELAGGVTLDMGIYPITLANYLLNALPAQVQSQARMTESGVDVLASYQFRYPVGAQATIASSFALRMRNEAMIYGSDGWIAFPDFQAGERFTVVRHDGGYDRMDLREVHVPNPANGFVGQVAEVVRGVREGRTDNAVIPLDETVATMALMDGMRAEWGLQYPGE